MLVTTERFDFKIHKLPENILKIRLHLTEQFYTFYYNNISFRLVILLKYFQINHIIHSFFVSFLILLLTFSIEGNAQSTKTKKTPYKYKKIEAQDPFKRSINSYIIPKKWTNIESPLNDLKVIKNWSLTDYRSYYGIGKLNLETRLLGPVAKPPKEHCRKLLIKETYKSMGNFNLPGDAEYEANFNACLLDLRTSAYEGNTEWLTEVLESWARNNFSQPKKPKDSSMDYDWFRSLNYAATLYALYKDSVTFSETFKLWLERSFLDTELKNFDIDNNTFNIRGIVKSDLIYGNDCSTPRFMYTQAFILGGLALESQEIFEEGIDSLQYILSLFDTQNIYTCWAMRGIRAATYHNQIPVWLSSYHMALETLGYDFFEHLMPNGSKVYEAADMTFDTIWNDDLGPILEYAKINLGVPENKNWQDLKLPMSERLPQYLPSKPQKIIRNSLPFIEKYRPDLKKKFGYERYHDRSVLGEKIISAYKDPDYYHLFMGDVVIDIDALFRAKNYDKELAEFKRRKELKRTAIEKALNELDSHEGSYKCSFKIGRKESNNSISPLASGDVTIIDGEPLFFNDKWLSNNGNVSEVFLNENAFLKVSKTGELHGTLQAYTMIGTPRKDAFTFGSQFSNQYLEIPLEGKNLGISEQPYKGLSIEVEFFFCDITDPVSKDELEKQEKTINTQGISTHFYKVVKNEDFIKFKGHIEDKDGQYFGNRRLNFGLMFDFRKNGSHSIESLQNFKISVSAKDLGEKEEIEKIRICKKTAFWEDNGQIAEINIQIKHYDENTCMFDKLPIATSKLLALLAENLSILLAEATFNEEHWKELLYPLVSNFE